MTEQEIQHKIDREVRALTDKEARKKAIRRFVNGLCEMEMDEYITFPEFCRLMAYLFKE